jgi:hypothetical protein
MVPICPHSVLVQFVLVAFYLMPLSSHYVIDPVVILVILVIELIPQ